MSESSSATELPGLIQQLLDQRHLHSESITEIDQTLAKVNAALGGTATAAAVSKSAVSKSVSKSAAKPADVKVSVVKSRRGKRGRFAVSTGELVLAFVKSKGNPTTQKVMEYLASEGRTTSSGSNALSTLTTAGKLKRTPLGKGIPGSTYSIA